MTSHCLCYETLCKVIVKKKSFQIMCTSFFLRHYKVLLFNILFMQLKLLFYHMIT